MHSWKRLREQGSPPLSLGEKYTNEQDQAILARSIESFDLHNKAIVRVGSGHGRGAEFPGKKGARNVMITDVAIKQLLSSKIMRAHVEIMIGRRVFHTAHSGDGLAKEGTSPATSLSKKAITER